MEEFSGSPGCGDVSSHDRVQLFLSTPQGPVSRLWCRTVDTAMLDLMGTLVIKSPSRSVLCSVQPYNFWVQAAGVRRSDHDTYPVFCPSPNC